MASIQLKDLVPGKNYKVKVRAKYKGEDPGPWSKILNFKAPIKSKDDDDDTLNSKYGIVVGSKKDPKRGYIISSTFNGKITLKNGLVIDDDKNNTNIGTQGWAIDHKGNSIFNNIVARGQLIIDLNNNQGRMYFGENIPAFGTDKADGIKLDTYNYWFRTKSIADKRPSWRVGDSDSFVSYNPDSNSADGKLIVSGQIQAGIGSANQVLLGANVGGAGIAGIKIDASNFWYDADKVANNAIVFKVSGADTTGITVNKAGRVTINTDHSGGRMTGPLTIRLTQGQAADKFLIGQDVRGSGQDGIVLNSNNYWTLQDGAGTSKTAYFKVGGPSKYILWDGNDLTVSAQIQAGVGTNNTVLIGPDVGGSGIGGIKLDSNNFWYDPTKVTGTNIFFQVKSDNQQTSISVAKGGNVLINGEQTGGSVTGTLNVTTGKVSIPYATNKNILIGKNVSGTNDGLYLDANNYWYVPAQGSVFSLKIGGATKNLSYDGDTLGLKGATIKTSDLDSYILFDPNKIEGVYTSDGVTETRFRIGVDGNAIFKGQINSGSKIGSSTNANNNIIVNNPNIVQGGSVLNNITFQGTYNSKPRAITITPDTGGGQMLFVGKDDQNLDRTDGAVFSTAGSKYADSRNGWGVAVGNPTGFPFIEVGYKSETEPKVSLYTRSLGTDAVGDIIGVGLEIRRSTFVLRGDGGAGSRIRGIPVVSTPTPGKRVLYGGENEGLEWAVAPTGSGGGSTTLSLGASQTDRLLTLTGSASAGYVLNTTQRPVTGADANNINDILVTDSDGWPVWRDKVPEAAMPDEYVNAVGTNTVSGLSLSKTGRTISLSGSITQTSGYTNGTVPGTANKITYSGSAPLSGRTNGDIHFVL